jgi:translation initiation factor RLI1
MDRNITTRKWELNNFTKEELIDMYINIYDAQTRAENAIDFLEMAKQSLEEEVERLKQRDYQGVLQNICETLKEIRDILKRG